MPNPSDSVRRVSEWHLAPRHVVASLAIHILNSLGATSTGQTLFGEHGIFFLVVLLAHEKVIHVFEVLLQQFEGFPGVSLVGKLLGQSFNDFIESIKQTVFQ